MADGSPIGVNDFDSHNPGFAYIEILFTALSNASGVAEEMNIHVNDCGGSNRLQDLKKLTRITLPGTGGPFEFNLTNPVVYSNHVHYDIDPNVTLDSDRIESIDVCKNVDFFPTVASDFRLNDYNAVYNDASELRRSDYIFEVDNERSGSTVAPQNINSILDGTAVTASVQDSNYSSVSIISGRYTGTKTNKQEYGISSALSGKIFTGRLFEPITSIQTIISQSNEPKFEELIFTLDDGFNYAVTNNKLDRAFSTTGQFSGSLTADTPNARFIKIQSQFNTSLSVNQGSTPGDNLPAYYEDVGTGQNGTYFVTGSEVLNTAVHSGSFNNFGGVDSNTVFALTNHSGGDRAREFFQVERVEFNQAARPKEGTTFLFLKSGSRNYPTQNINIDVWDYTGTEFSTLGTYADNGDNVDIHVCIGDTIFKSINNRLHKVTNKKLLVEETGEILYINDNGQLIWNYGYKEDLST